MVINMSKINNTNVFVNSVLFNNTSTILPEILKQFVKQKMYNNTSM